MKAITSDEQQTMHCVNINMELDFHYYQTPSQLYDDPAYQALSMDAIALYTMLLNRTSLSRKNHFFDKPTGDIYVFFSREEACQKLRCGRNKATACFKQLRAHHLIREIAQNTTKRQANKIFVMLPLSATRNPQKEHKTRQARKTVREKRKEILHALNQMVRQQDKQIKQNKQCLKQQDQQIAKQKNNLAKLADLIRQGKQKQLDQSTPTVTPDTIDQIKQQIAYDYVTRHCTPQHQIIAQQIVECIAEMQTAQKTKIHGVFQASQHLTETLRHLNCHDMLALIPRIHQAMQRPIAHTKAYLKSMIVQFAQKVQIDLATFTP